MVLNSTGGLDLVGSGSISGFIFSQVCEDNLTKQSQFSNNEMFSQLCTNQTFNNSNCSLCNYKITKCNVRNCKTCPIFDENHTFISSVTGRQYYIDIDGDVSCTSTNLVYFLQHRY